MPTDKNSKEEFRKKLIRATREARDIALSVFPNLAVLRAIEKLLERPGELDPKIEEARQSLLKTRDLLSEVESTLESRVAKLDKIREEYEQYSVLATTEKAKADAIMNELKNTVKSERRIAFMIALVTGIIVFLFGAIVGKYAHFP